MNDPIADGDPENADVLRRMAQDGDDLSLVQNFLCWGPASFLG